MHAAQLSQLSGWLTAMPFGPQLLADWHISQVPDLRNCWLASVPIIWLSDGPYGLGVIVHLFHDLYFSFSLPFPPPLPNFLTIFLISHAHDQ